MESESNGGEVRLSALVQFIFVQTNGFKFVKLLAEQFQQVEMIE